MITEIINNQEIGKGEEEEFDEEEVVLHGKEHLERKIKLRKTEDANYDAVEKMREKMTPAQPQVQLILFIPCCFRRHTTISLGSRLACPCIHHLHRFQTRQTCSISPGEPEVPIDCALKDDVNSLIRVHP